MFDSRREHEDSIASRWEINRERFAGEDLSNDWIHDMGDEEFAAWVAENEGADDAEN